MSVEQDKAMTDPTRFTNGINTVCNMQDRNAVDHTNRETPNTNTIISQTTKLQVLDTEKYC